MIDRILTNGHIVTLDADNPTAEAIAISYGRIVAVGTNDDILALKQDDTVVEDLQGATVIPGLTDAHIHWEGTARFLQAVNLFEVPSLEEAIQRVKKRAEKTPIGEWLTGHGWLQDLWDGKAFPSAQDLDIVSPEHPAYFTAKSGHAGWANSKALEIAGIHANTPDPEGGEILRDADGNPTGILLETAMNLVAEKVPVLSAEQLADYMKYAQDLALASGITGIHDYDNPSCLNALQILRERGELAIRVVKQINKDWFEAALSSGIRNNFGDEWIRIGGLKLFADGAIGPRTAYMVEPYIGEPDNRGIVVVGKDEMLPLVMQASRNGLPSTIHAIGDQAMRDVLDVFEAVRADEAERGLSPDVLRHRIEHVQILHPDDKDRLAELSILASMQPIHATSDWEVATAYWGEERCKFAYNARYQLDKGVTLVFGSDAPVEPFEPFKGIHAAVTRQRPDGSPEGGWFPEMRLTLDEALHGFTTGAAYAANMEDELGQIKVGFLADCVVLESNPYEMPAEDLHTMGIRATMVGGEWRYGQVN